MLQGHLPGSESATCLDAASITAPCSMPRAICARESVADRGEDADLPGPAFRSERRRPSFAVPPATKFEGAILGALDAPDQLTADLRKAGTVAPRPWLALSRRTHRYENDGEGEPCGSVLGRRLGR